MKQSELITAALKGEATLVVKKLMYLQTKYWKATSPSRRIPS